MIHVLLSEIGFAMWKMLLIVCIGKCYRHINTIVSSRCPLNLSHSKVENIRGAWEQASGNVVFIIQSNTKTPSFSLKLGLSFNYNNWIF